MLPSIGNNTRDNIDKFLREKFEEVISGIYPAITCIVNDQSREKLNHDSEICYFYLGCSIKKMWWWGGGGMGVLVFRIWEREGCLKKTFSIYVYTYIYIYIYIYIY